MNYNIRTLSSAEFKTCPWGNYTILEEAEGYKVKKIEVLSGKRLDYQRHHQHEEHWIVVNGVALVTLNGREIYLRRGERMHIPTSAAHSIENTGDGILVLVEIQLGSYLGEDDVEPLQDDFVRETF